MIDGEAQVIGFGLRRINCKDDIMQRKWVLVAIALVAMSGIILGYSSSVYSDAEESGDNTVTYSVSLNYGNERGIPRTIHLILNENYFQNIDENHVMEWYYLDNDYRSISFQDENGNSSVTSMTYTITEGGTPLFEFQMKRIDIGKYDLTMTSLTGSIQKTTQLKLKCDVMITIRDGGHLVREYATDPMYINVNISLNNATDLPTSLSYTIDSTTYNEGDIVYLAEGEPVTMRPNVSATYTADKYYWYAVGLPLGMAMTSTGIISGVPIVPSSGELTMSTIYVEDGFGNGKTFTFAMWVSEKTIDLSFYLYNGTIDSNTDLSDCVYEPTQFFTQRQKTVNMAIYNLDPSSTLKVSVVKINDSSSTVDISRKEIEKSGTATINVKTYDVYSLPTDGTGVYRVDIRDQTGILQDRFDLYVMSKLLSVESAIIVGSDSTS